LRAETWSLSFTYTSSLMLSLFGHNIFLYFSVFGATENDSQRKSFSI
jgi:hypothetical protein